ELVDLARHLDPSPHAARGLRAKGGLLVPARREVMRAVGRGYGGHGEKRRDLGVVNGPKRGVTLRRMRDRGQFVDQEVRSRDARRRVVIPIELELLHPRLLVSDEPGFFRLIHETKGLHKKVIDALAERLAPTAL